MSTLVQPHHQREALARLRAHALTSFVGIHSVEQALAHPTAGRLLTLHAVLIAKGLGPYRAAPRRFDHKAAAAGDLVQA